MAARARAGEPEGLWLRAQRQTGGKGRQGRVWESPEGNLYASVLIRPRPGDPRAESLALVAGVALQEVVARFVPEARLKWPNDLLVENAKLAGILLEREGEAVIAGFGVNLASAPDFLERPATSVAALTGETLNPDFLLDCLAEAFARWTAQWRERGLGPVCSRWLEVAHPRGTALITSEGAGLFDGLDESGALLLRLQDGQVRTIRAGDVFLI